MNFEASCILPNRHIVRFNADSKDGLIEAIYQSKELDPQQASMLTDIVEVKYGDDPPGLFSWTEGVKKVKNEDLGAN